MLRAIDDATIPVVIGVPCAGRWRMWAESGEEFALWLGEPALVDLLGWGRIARVEVRPSEAREVGLLDRKTLKLSLLARSADTLLSEGIAFSGVDIQLSDRPASLEAGLHQLEAVLTNSIFHVAMAGGSVLVEPGGWGPTFPPKNVPNQARPSGNT
jgi:hypothetical protein